MQSLNTIPRLSYLSLKRALLARGSMSASLTTHSDSARVQFRQALATYFHAQPAQDGKGSWTAPSLESTTLKSTPRLLVGDPVTLMVSQQSLSLSKKYVIFLSGLSRIFFFTIYLSIYYLIPVYPKELEECPGIFARAKMPGHFSSSDGQAGGSGDFKTPVH